MDIVDKIQTLMLSRIADIFAILLVVVFIVDVSGAVDSLRHEVNKELKREEDAPIPPFDCSMCVTWWASFVYVAVTGWSWPLLAVAAVASFLARIVRECYFLIEELLLNIVSNLCSKITRN